MQEIEKKKKGLGFEMPNGWQIQELGKMVDEKRPVTYGIVQTGEHIEGGVPCIRVTDIINGQIDKSNLITTTKQISDGYKRTILKNGDLIMALRGKIGQIAKVDYDLIGANLTRGVALIALKDDFYNDFILHQISSDITMQVLERSLNGSALQELSIGVLRKIPILLPPLHEQQAIADCLSTWDGAIQATEQLIRQKELQKKWLMQQLLTGKKRLKGFSGEWREIHIRDVAKEVSIRNKSDKQLTVLSCTKYDGLVPSLEYFGRKIFADDVSTYKIVPKHHFAYATNHIEEGSIGYQEIFDEALISPMYTVFKTDKSINDEFFYMLLKSHPLVYQYQNRMEGSIDRRGGLRWDAFSIIKIHIPSIEEQTAIAQVLQAADKEIILLKAKAEKLREQKKGLMQQLLTGRVRLKINSI